MSLVSLGSAAVAVREGVEALDQARARLERFTAMPNPSSLQVEQLALDAKCALYDVNTSAWGSASGRLVALLGPLSDLANALARQQRALERADTRGELVTVVMHLVRARKRFRQAVRELRTARVA